MDKKELFEIFYDYVITNIVPDFTQNQCEKFSLYFDELLEWNKMFNLISFKTEEDIIYRHFCDSLYAVKAVKNITNQTDLKVADIGTGSGMPGIPFKIIMSQTKLTLVESITKKCSFLENAAGKLAFVDTEILNKRAEEIGQDKKYRQTFDIVLSRAVSKFSPNLEISIPLLKVGGHFIVHKTKKSAESPEEGLSSVENALRHLGAELKNTIYYNLPGQELDYCILIFQKYKDTPQQYPRRIGVPEKKPL